MNARIDTTLTLDEVANHIEQWREPQMESGSRSGCGTKRSVLSVPMGSRVLVEPCT
jgi:hypothetical protein